MTPFCEALTAFANESDNGKCAEYSRILQPGAFHDVGAVAHRALFVQRGHRLRRRLARMADNRRTGIVMRIVRMTAALMVVVVVMVVVLLLMMRLAVIMAGRMLVVVLLVVVVLMMLLLMLLMLVLIVLLLIVVVLVLMMLVDVRLVGVVLRLLRLLLLLQVNIAAGVALLDNVRGGRRRCG